MVLVLLPQLLGAVTFGVGTPSGPAITGAAVTGIAGSAGVATAVATGVIASKYDKFSKKLRQIKESFDKLHLTVCSLAKNLYDLKVQVDSLDYIVKYLEKASSTEEKDISAICQRIQKVHVGTTCLQTTHYKTTVQREEDELKCFFQCNPTY